MTATTRWDSLAPSSRQEQDRSILLKAIQLAQDFEAKYRPHRVEPVECLLSFELLCWVTYAHLVRGIELCRAVFEIRESPVANVLMRVLSEAFINLQFIECDPELRVERAKDFSDFRVPDMVLLLREVGRHYPETLEQAGTTDAELRQKLEAYRERFCHAHSDGAQHWDWNNLDLVSRVEAYAKVLSARGIEDRQRHRTVLMLYRDTNAYVHTGMRSLESSVVAAGLGETLLPRVVSEEASVNNSRLAASLLHALLAICTRILNCSDFDERIADLSREILGP